MSSDPANGDGLHSDTASQMSGGGRRPAVPGKSQVSQGDRKCVQVGEGRLGNTRRVPGGGGDGKHI